MWRGRGLIRFRRVEKEDERDTFSPLLVTNSMDILHPDYQDKIAEKHSSARSLARLLESYLFVTLQSLRLQVFYNPDPRTDFSGLCPEPPACLQLS